MKNVTNNYLSSNKNYEMKNAISWFEIPATDLNRAQEFYETIFGVTLNTLDLPNIKMRMFPLEDMMGVGGAVVDSGGFHKPSTTLRNRSSTATLAHFPTPSATPDSYKSHRCM